MMLSASDGFIFKHLLHRPEKGRIASLTNVALGPAGRLEIGSNYMQIQHIVTETLGQHKDEETPQIYNKPSLYVINDHHATVRCAE